MNELRFIQIQKDNQEHYKIFKDMMIPYNRELDQDKTDTEPVSEDFTLKIAQGCINMQGVYDRHLEIAFIGDDPIGFLYGKVDHENHKGHKNRDMAISWSFTLNPDTAAKGMDELCSGEWNNIFQVTEQSGCISIQERQANHFGERWVLCRQTKSNRTIIWRYGKKKYTGMMLSPYL